MNSKLQVLLQERKRFMNKIRTLDSVIRASIVEIIRKCGRKECWCAKKEDGHPALYLSRSLKGKTKMAYLPTSKRKIVEEWISNYRKLETLLEELTKVNIKILKEK